MIENITEMNPLGILTAFGQEATPLCKKITRKHKASSYVEKLLNIQIALDHITLPYLIYLKVLHKD